MRFRRRPADLLIFRFNEKANPTPVEDDPQLMLEVAWTIMPVLILVLIAIPSFRLLTHQFVMPEDGRHNQGHGPSVVLDLRLSSDQGGGFNFDSYMKADKDLKPGELRLLAVDNEAVVPVNKVVLVQVTATDVIHALSVPSFGVRIDAVPGRLNETWFKAEREGVYYGQCSKLCGKDHAFMPIVFRVVSEDDYDAWLADAKKKFASANASDSPARKTPASR